MHRSVEIALEEVGYVEKATQELLDEKLSNAGSGNYTKYARDLDELPAFYNGRKQGCPWCDVFVDWCFMKAYGWRRAERMLCQPPFGRGAGCRYSMGYYRWHGRLEKTPQEGDQIFFRVDGKICHTGLVTAVDDQYVCTVEGNTSQEEGVVPNGGCVRAKRYARNSPLIAGYGRPKYTSNA